jgi:hypothetical protein
MVWLGRLNNRCAAQNSIQRVQLNSFMDALYFAQAISVALVRNSDNDNARINAVMHIR